MSKKLPEDFIFGGATAAYQAEGATKTVGKGVMPGHTFWKEISCITAKPAVIFYIQYPLH